MKKSQLHSQIFIYILTIIIISLVFIYGYNAIVNFKNRAEQVACLKFQNDLKNAVESTSGDFGSVRKKDLQVCGNNRLVCFVESFDNPSLPAGTDPIIKDSVNSNTGRNVFLIEKIAQQSFYAGVISVEPDVLCVRSVENKISLRLESKGDHVLLSRWAG